MNSIFRAVTRLGPELRPIKGHIMRYNLICKKWAHNFPTTYDFTRERILMILRLFDKIDPNKLTLESHFIKDLGLDSLDHVEIIMQIEDEFNYEIPDKDAEKLLRPKDLLRYLTDHDEAYEELQKLQKESHHHDHAEHGDGHHTGAEHHISAGSHNDHTATNPQKRTFCSIATFSKRYLSDDKDKYPTSFRAAPPEPINIHEIQDRVMRVCSKYDKIDSSQLQLTSHFVDDLGLDSLDHVEILMELEDEFGLEIPDQDAEKLMRPVEIARFIFQKEEARSVQTEDRKW